MTQENKKKIFIVVGIVAAFVILSFLIRKNKSNGIGSVSGSGTNPNTYYLTNNIPPLNAGGYAAPNFGPVTIGTGSGSGPCGGCDTVTNFGNTDQLAQYLNNSSNYTAALQDALNNAPPYAPPVTVA